MFSTLDASQAYLSIPLAETLREYMAFLTPMGLFEFNRTAFGLLNAGARYNRVAHDAEVEAGDGCQNYVDDTLGRSKDEEEHLDLLRRIFQSYRLHSLLIHPAKTRLYQS